METCLRIEKFLIEFKALESPTDISVDRAKLDYMKGDVALILQMKVFMESYF